VILKKDMLDERSAGSLVVPLAQEIRGELSRLSTLRWLKPESLEAFGKDGFRRSTPTLQVSKPNPAQRKNTVGSNDFKEHSIRRLRWSSAIEQKKSSVRH